MKKTLFFLLLPFLPVTGSAAIIAGFYTFDGTSNAEPAEITASGFTSTINKNTTSNGSGGGSSNDNFYGNSSLQVLPTAAHDGVIRMIAGSFTLTTTYSASAVGSYSLSTLLFDAGTTTGAGELTISYAINGGSTISLTPTALSMASVTAGYDNFPDYGLSFAGATLNPGDSLVLTFNMASGGTARLDNIALTGDLIPEPSVALLAAAGLVPLFRRRR